MLGDGGQEVGHAEDLEVAVDPGKLEKRCLPRKGAEDTAQQSRNHKEKDRIMGRRNGLKWQHRLYCG